MASQSTEPAQPAVLTQTSETGSPGTITSLLDEVRDLASDAKTLVEAEVAYQTSRARVAGEAARNIALFGVAAFVFAFFALGGLTVGLILALTPLVTAWGATAIVVGALALAAIACTMAAAGRVKWLKRALGGSSGEHSAP